MSKSDEKKLLEHLDRVFPHLNMYNESYRFNNDMDVCPTEDMNWKKIIKILNENGMSINYNNRN